MQETSAYIYPTANVVVMRHSVRADSKSGALWPDCSSRPYDPPIIDSELPQRAALELVRALGGSKIHREIRIVSSPFRRCLQTAGIVARALEVASVDVHLSLGEAMVHVARTGATELRPLLRDEMQSALLFESGASLGDFKVDRDCDGAPRASGRALQVQLGSVEGELPEFNSDDKRRFMRTISAFLDQTRTTAKQRTAAGRGEEGADGDGASTGEQPHQLTLLISHGDALDAAASLQGYIVLEAPECSWVSLRTDDGGVRAEKSERVVWMCG
jgi:broad specificity phosphatase PhoE